MMILRAILAAGAASALLAAAGAASAAQAGNDLPLSSGFEYCTSGASGTSTGGNDGSCVNGGAAASFSPAPFPGVQAHASGGTPFGFGAEAALTYYFRVDGPGTDPVEVSIAANLYTDVAGVGNAFAEIITSSGNGVCVDTDEGLCASSQFHSFFTEMDTPGAIYSIQLEAIAADNGAFGGAANAGADPFISVIGPNADLYRIEVSPDAINAEGPGVPEPASWALMIMGFGLAGAALRTQQRTAVKRAS
jgi:hypothetical protein